MLRKNEKPRGYNQKFDVEIASVYSSERCKDCYGKGYVITEIGSGENITIRKNAPITQFAYYCSCAARNIKKYG